MRVSIAYDVPDPTFRSSFELQATTQVPVPFVAAAGCESDHPGSSVVALAASGNYLVVNSFKFWHVAAVQNDGCPMLGKGEGGGSSQPLPGTANKRDPITEQVFRWLIVDWQSGGREFHNLDSTYAGHKCVIVATAAAMPLRTAPSRVAG